MATNHTPLDSYGWVTVSFLSISMLLVTKWSCLTYDNLIQSTRTLPEVSTIIISKFNLSVRFQWQCHWLLPPIKRRGLHSVRNTRPRFLRSGVVYCGVKRLIYSDREQSRGKCTNTPGSDACDLSYTSLALKFSDSLIVWGCFTYQGVGNLFFHTNRSSSETEKKKCKLNK